MSWSPALLALALAAAPGCRPSVESGQFTCDPLALEPCPAGMACMIFADGYQCHRPGPWRCGNGRLEPGEQCDGDDFGDRRCTAYDGRDVVPQCSPDCRVVCCGNGRIEGSGAVTEGCDDGNQRSHDGCSSNCVKETPVWEPWESPWERGRAFHTLTHFPPRASVVLFGGESPAWTNASVYGDTWEWNGVQWTRRVPAESPPARWLHATVYDALRERLVTFGGVHDIQPLGDTWEFDGLTWAEVAESGPPARHSHTMAYDTQRGVTVLYGGVLDPAPLSFFGDTWEWDGVAWTERTFPPGTTPPPLAGHAMAYDARRGRTVLAGGTYRISEDAVGFLDTLWEYDGNAWADTGVSLPFDRVEGAVYDSLRQRVVLMGAPPDGTITDQVWVWDGTAIEELATADAPPERSYFGVAYDATRHVMVINGGVHDDVLHSSVSFSDTWELTGQHWRETHPVMSPITVNGLASMAYDSLRQRLLLLTPDPPSQTWIFDMLDWGWKRLHTNPPPEFNGGAPLAYEARDDRFVLFGVRDPATGRSNRTWIFQDALWRELPMDVLPDAAGGCARMTYDTARQRVLMLAADETLPGGALTWALQGDRWEPLDAPPLPVVVQGSACAQGALTYDASDQRALYFGGAYDGSTFLGASLWALEDPDGQAEWVELGLPAELPLGSEAPFPFSQAGLQAFRYSSRFGRSVLVVRDDFDGRVRTLEYQRQRWVETTPALGPETLQVRPYLGFGPDRSSALLVRPTSMGEWPDQQWTYEVWRFYYHSSEPDEQCEDERDEDGDGAHDCDDPDCCDHERCRDSPVCLTPGP